ncbi:putative acid phosphatase protein [Phaeoacremonium minimum UCRPA7]|uniref:Putative acid phosphatase protein n=1 Tax=Phaeoacremonium minimum (strain UCR-PA7) TaxID=1286976 RepID=R8BBP8_PHAM7|nr:putative acid phosphatase protein [Phaeoacremonium minimum UCRPA7]EON96763.1 putative acid phosphatase protein [Phaeoacremonium minimum UCRPA7]
MRAQAITLLAAAGSALAQTQYTATSTKDVYVAQATAKSLSPTSNVKGKMFDRLAIIWLENTDYELAAGDPNLAWLATKGITLSNHFAVTHPSEPNYVAAIGGDYFGMNNDNFNFIDANVSTIVDLLDAKGISWSEYQEDMPYSGFEGFAWVNQQNGANDYVRKHNPAIIYDSVAKSDDRIAKTKNLTMFWKDLENETLPQWMFITPNMTSDGHDTSVTVAGTWTRTFLEPLLNDKRFMNNTLVLITFDENSTYAKQNRILGILLGDAVPEKYVGTTDSNFYNHYSEIASVCANWDLKTLGRWDVGANVWQVVAEKTGDVIRPWSGDIPLAQMYWNQSYDGVFNSAVVNGEYPRPNACIKRSGRSILPAIGALWKGNKNPNYYEDKIEIPDGLHPPAHYGFKG